MRRISVIVTDEEHALMVSRAPQGLNALIRVALGLKHRPRGIKPDGSSVRDRMLQFLRANWHRSFNQGQIRAVVPTGEEYAGACLRTLCREGKIERTGFGLYRAKAPAAEQRAEA